jgi:hypothetical protein
VSNKERGHFMSSFEMVMETGSHLFVIASCDLKPITELIAFLYTFILVGYLMTLLESRE